jgi:hypothetical protein
MTTAAPSPALGYDLFALSSRTSGFGLYDLLCGDSLRPPQQLASDQVRRDDIDAHLDLDPCYRESNWNGEGADPVSNEAIKEARAFLYKFPTTMPLPEVIAEPDGYLGLEWYSNKRLLYVVSFNGQGVLSCSGLIGQTKVYGTYYMDDGIPSEILRTIARIVQ